MEKYVLKIGDLIQVKNSPMSGMVVATDHSGVWVRYPGHEWSYHLGYDEVEPLEECEK